MTIWQYEPRKFPLSGTTDGHQSSNSKHCMWGIGVFGGDAKIVVKEARGEKTSGSVPPEIV